MSADTYVYLLWVERRLVGVFATRGRAEAFAVRELGTRGRIVTMERVNR